MSLDFNHNLYLAPDSAVPHENCIYYNTTNHQIIIDAYEGIPQNLLLNFIGWMVLIALFTLLRRRAGNYGRIALVQRADDNSWTHLFYGRLDDESRIGRASTSESASISSAGSNLINDKGTFAWILAILRIKKGDIIERCGPDAAQYISFQRHIIFLMFVMMCTSLIIVLPVNFQGQLEGDETTFGHTTLSNLDPDSNLLWIHITISVLYFPLAVVIMRRFSVRAKIQESSQCSTKTVMISNIPRNFCDKDDILKYFEKAHPQIEIDDIVLAVDISRLSKLKQDLDTVTSAKKYSEEYFASKQTRLEILPFACGFIFRCCGCRKVDAIEYYSAEKSRLTREYELARRQALSRPLGIAFVILKTEDDAVALFKKFKRAWYYGEDLKTEGFFNLKPQNWEVAFAPENSDVLWENLSSSTKYWYIRATFINLVLFLVLFFLTTPAYVVNLVNTIPFQDAIEKINPFLSQFVPTLILVSVAALMPVIVSYSDQWLVHWTKSERNFSIMVKTFVFLLFMVLILPAIGLTSAKAFVDWTWHLKNETYRWECLFLPDKGAFFVNYITTSTFIGTSLELIRFSELFVYAIRICLTRSKAETSAVRKAVLWDFPFGVQYAWMLLIFAMTTAFSISCPLITPFGLLYMLLKHAVDKHNLYFAYSPSKINSEIHATAINCVMFSVVLVQASFLGLSLLRRGFNAISCFALAGFCLTILFFIINVVFSCCKGFSPISYERAVQTPPVDAEAAESRSNWYASDYLQEIPLSDTEPNESPRTYGTRTSDTSGITNNDLYQDYQHTVDA